MNNKQNLTEFQKGVKSALTREINIVIFKNGKFEPIKDTNDLVFSTPQANMLENIFNDKN